MRRFVLVAALALTSCAVTEYARPPLDVPERFRFAPTEVAEIIDAPWWMQFGDPVLPELIRTAVENNRDVRIAAARVEAFAGRLRQARAPLFPQIGYSAQGSRTRGSERLGAPGVPGVENPTNEHGGVLTAAWELDLFGRVRNLSQAARADLLAQESARRAVLLATVAAVANGYVDLRGLDRQLEIARATLVAYEATLALFELRFQGGVISELELAQVRSLVEQARARIPSYEKRVALQEDALSVLIGANPGPIARGASITGWSLPGIPAGLPSMLLERRPDLAQAEQALAAAEARIAAARALYFPTLSLTGLLGTASDDLSGLFTGPARTWSYAGTLAGPVFTGGAIAGTVEVATARQKEALEGYRQAIQNAFREVDDALVDQVKTREELDARSREVTVNRRYAELARLRFDNGYTSYLEVLDAERALFDAELGEAATRAALFQTLVNVNKALGNGWPVDAPLATPTAID